MNEVVHLPESECSRARVGMAAFVDGDLSALESQWLRRHLESCAECRAVLAGFVAIDTNLTEWGQRLERENPPAAGARERLAASLQTPPVQRSINPWIPVAAAAIAAALLLVTVVPRGNPTALDIGRPKAAFIAIPYLAPLDPRENTAIVRMDIRVGTLIAVGYRVTGDPEATVPAEVLVGEDGRAHAVRVLADINWNGTGD